MFSRACGAILGVLLLATMLILKLVFFLCNENEAVEIDLSDVEGWKSEYSTAQPELSGKESESEITKAASAG
jgi:hypothetical protein